MRRRAGEPELITALDVALLLDVYQNNVRSVSGLPEAYQDDLATGTVWRLDEILDLVERRESREVRWQRYELLQGEREKRAAKKAGRKAA